MRKRDIEELQHRISEVVSILLSNNVKSAAIGNVQAVINSNNTLHINVLLDDK